ncbi:MULTISPECIES: DUF3325 domain-containing protein [unclassified Cupriavidus]|uniref:DUF3325 domain-containing protein n=1 Tax=Cupriavidus sp. H19C3 TaxID=3241603 RepID=UPI0011DABF2F|nr:MAG: DUF3325 domain-containing protein [Cupriavidus sp.]
MTSGLAWAGFAGLGFAFSGFAWLAQSIDRHHAELHGRGSEPARAHVLRLRTQGYLALALALVACVVTEGWAFGLLYWAGVLSVCAWGTVALVSTAPRLTRRLAPAAAALSMLAVGFLMLS